MKVFNKKTTTTTTEHEPMSRRTIAILISIVVLVIGLFAGILLVQQRQTPQKQASETGPSCPLDGFRCTWEKEADVTYECIIHELTASGSIEVARPTIKETEDGKGLCTYTPEADKQYSCTVKAILFPGCEASDTATGLCTALTPTPSATPTPSPTMTPTPTPNPACYVTECDPDIANQCDTLGLPNHSCTDTDPTTGTDYRCILNEKCVNAPADNPQACWCYAPTPTPSPTPTATPTPTTRPSATPTATPGPTSTPGATATTAPTVTPSDIIVVNPTSTPVPTGTAVVQTSPAPTVVTATPAPTLPVAGLPNATYLILLVGLVVVAIGLAL